MEKNICSSCGTENEAEYKYCKNCGAEIEVAQREPETQFADESDYAQPQQNYNYTANSIFTDNISGIPMDEVACFIGKKANNILPKFSKMELSGSKVSWCWPVAVLGYLFGPIGAAFWFFYRKMYKPAVILSVIGAVTTILTTVLTGGIEIDFEAIYEAVQAGDIYGYLNALGLDSSARTLTVVISSLINNIVSILSCVIGGMFALNAYKNHCVEKIISYRAVQADQRYYKLGLASIGGVSGGMVVLGIVIMMLTSNVASMISTITEMLLK